MARAIDIGYVKTTLPDTRRRGSVDIDEATRSVPASRQRDKASHREQHRRAPLTTRRVTVVSTTSAAGSTTTASFAGLGSVRHRPSLQRPRGASCARALAATRPQPAAPFGLHSWSSSAVGLRLASACLRAKKAVQTFGFEQHYYNNHTTQQIDDPYTTSDDLTFTPLVIGELDVFVDRWAEWFARTVQGTLSHPTQMPEHQAQGSWRR